MPINVNWAGRLEYGVAWERQKALVAARVSDLSLPDELLLLEHPPTYTLGRNGRFENLLLTEAELAAEGFAYYHVDRGGDITYHGPGQLVGYPILDLNRLYDFEGRFPVRRYVTDLEQVLIQTLAAFDIVGRRHEHHRGVWVMTENGLCKIAAVGIRVSGRGISSHGFALNVNPDLSHFNNIIPCGIDDLGVTRMTDCSSRALNLEQVVPVMLEIFAAVFGAELAGDAPALARDSF